jgi:predicted transcriptional regulator YdeE
MNQETKNCQNCKKNFVIEPEDFQFYEKMKVPVPTFCPDCRFQRRAAFRNERKFFKVKDAFTGKEIFSLWPEEGGKKVVSQEEWYGDGWDPMDYGVDYNFSKTFFQQIRDLRDKVPIFNLNVEFMVNSPYCGNATALKNSYLCFNSSYSEDCMYGNAIDYSKDCIDDSHISRSERCYESFWLQNCYQCHFTIMSVDSRNLWFCRDCLGCNDCFGCANLRKSSYCILNKQYTKEEYLMELDKMGLDTFSGIEKARQEARTFWNTQIIKYHQGLKNLNSTGSYVTNCKNVNDSFLVREGENMRYCQYMLVPKTKDCYDATIWGSNTELSYEICTSGGNAYNLKFCANCWPSCRDSEYCMDLFSSSNCFGCVGLKKAQYCIFNKQYTKEEYFELVKKIKAHMDEMPHEDKQGNVYKYGEFFPIEFSTFGYNNSIAIQFFPISKEEAIEKGYLWIEAPKGNYNITKKAGELPDSISEVSKNITEEVLECANCKSPYKIIEGEFNFLQKENLPLPHICHDCRYERRISDRLKTTLYNRECMCDKTNHVHSNNPCGKKFKTGYASARPEIVYCENCYNKEVA